MADASSANGAELLANNIAAASSLAEAFAASPVKRKRSAALRVRLLFLIGVLNALRDGTAAELAARTPALAALSEALAEGRRLAGELGALTGLLGRLSAHTSAREKLLGGLKSLDATLRASAAALDPPMRPGADPAAVMAAFVASCRAGNDSLSSSAGGAGAGAGGGGGDVATARSSDSAASSSVHGAALGGLLAAMRAT
jgi:hypothetical protein